MKKRYLFCLLGLFLLAFVALVGCKQKHEAGGGTEVPTTDPCTDDVPEPKGDVAEDMQVNSIQFANFKKNGILKKVPDKDDPNRKIDDFKEAKCFKKKFSGPYILKEEPTVAYIAIKVDITKPAGDDFSVTVENENSRLDPVELSRTASEPFTCAKVVNDSNISSNGLIVLTKGKNSIIVKIAKNGKEAEYKFIVNYDGGPEEKSQDVIDGIYCPTMRKLTKEEKEDPNKTEKDESILAIYIAGW